jgi:hypothetical protein
MTELQAAKVRAVVLVVRSQPHQPQCPSTYLVYQVDGRLEVEAKVDEVPVNPLLLVLLLLVDEHRVIEELLQVLVRVVNAQLLEAILLVDLEPKTTSLLS